MVSWMGRCVVQAPSLPEPLTRQVNRAVEVLAQARRPILLVGNGVIRGQAHEAVQRFARQAHVPVVHTFMSKGVVPDSDPLSLYAIGLQMRDYPAVVIEQSDVVVAVGYDFVEYAPCLWNPNRDKHIVHVDVSPAEVDAHYIVDVGVLGDIALSLDQIGGQLAPFDSAWAEESRGLVQTAYEREWAQPLGWPLRPQHIVRDLRQALAPDDLVICDVGAHKLWMARMFPCEVAEHVHHFQRIRGDGHGTARGHCGQAPVSHAARRGCDRGRRVSDERPGTGDRRAAAASTRRADLA